MTRGIEAYKQPTDLFSEVIEWSLVLPSDEQPAFFDSQTNLFTEQKERSWVEFCSARERQAANIEENTIDSKGLFKTQTKDRGHDGTERIQEEERLWEIAKSRGKNPIHAFFIRQKNSNSPLLVSRELFDALVRSNQVLGSFKEFVLSFGWKKRELDIGPPHCRFNWSDADNEGGFSSDNLPRFECAYGLRYVELNGNSEGIDPWSVRQTAFYQKYDQGKQTWILISPSEDFQSKINDYSQRLSRFRDSDLPKNPFELHSFLIACAIANWRWYIKSLCQRATEQSSRVVAATVGKGKLSALIDFEINFEDRQLLKVVEDRVLDLLTIFDATLDTIGTLLQEYEMFRSNSGMAGRTVDKTLSKMKDSFREVELYRKKIKTLHKMVQGTASLLSNLLDYENAKIAEENGKALAILAQESREENSAMRALTEKATEDAAAVKVITLITIMFLPTTVVAGFFSTQFVKQSENGKLLELTDNWWLIVAISLPLTVFIIVIWYCWINFPWKRFWDEWWQRQRPPMSPRPSELDLSDFSSATSMRRGSELESGFRLQEIVSLQEAVEGPRWRTR